MKSLTTVFFRKKYLDTRPMFITTLFFFMMAFNTSIPKHTTQSATTDATEQTGWADPGEVTKENFKKDVKPDVQESKGSPNVLFVLYDGTGLAIWSPFGGGISMPTLQKLAHRVMMYNRWHTTEFCSPTRPSSRTERNHYLTGNAAIMETANGFPDALGNIPEQTITIGQILQQNGWSTFLISNDHNVPEQDIASRANRKQWPTQLGSDRYRAFPGGEASHWYPELVEDNYFTEALYDPEQGYHLSKGLTNKSSCFYRKTSISRSAERSTNSFK